jgi:hypothetical protein
MHHRRPLKAAGQGTKADEEPSPVLAAPPTGSVAPVPVAGLVARHTAAEHHGSDGSTMDLGERRAGSLSIHSLRPRSDRTTTPARAIRRVSLFVPHKDGAKSVFINDYHFIYRLGAAVSVKSSGTRVLSLFGLILGLVDPGLGRHPRRVGPTTEPRWVGMVGSRQGLLPGLVDRVGSPEMHR